MDDSSAVRRFTASLLPFLCMIFIIIVQSDNDVLNVQIFILSLTSYFKFGIGALLGIELVLIRKFFSKTIKNVPAVLIIIFLSAVGSFVLYAIVIQSLNLLYLFLFGLFPAAVLTLILVGFGETGKSRWGTPIFLLILVVNLVVTALMVLKPVFISAEVPQETLQLLPKHALHEEHLNYKEQAYIDLLESSFTYPNIDAANFKRAIMEMERLGSDSKIPVSLMLDMLEAAYPKANAGSVQHLEVSTLIINFLVKAKAKEACPLFYQIHSEGGTLFDTIEKAAVTLCDH